MDLGSGIWDPRSGIQDPGSEKYLFQISDPGSKVKKAPDRPHCSLSFHFEKAHLSRALNASSLRMGSLMNSSI
jgi:hypothetical protein